MKKVNYFIWIYKCKSHNPVKRNFTTWEAMQNYINYLNKSIFEDSIIVDYDVYEAHTGILLLSYKG